MEHLRGENVLPAQAAVAVMQGAAFPGHLLQEPADNRIGHPPARAARRQRDTLPRCASVHGGVGRGITRGFHASRVAQPQSTHTLTRSDRTAAARSPGPAVRWSPSLPATPGVPCAAGGNSRGPRPCSTPTHWPPEPFAARRAPPATETYSAPLPIAAGATLEAACYCRGEQRFAAHQFHALERHKIRVTRTSARTNTDQSRRLWFRNAGQRSPATAQSFRKL